MCDDGGNRRACSSGGDAAGVGACITDDVALMRVMQYASSANGARDAGGILSDAR